LASAIWAEYVDNNPDQDDHLLTESQGMVKNIVEKGNLDKPIIIHNRTVARAEKLVSSLPSDSAKVAKSLEDAVNPSDIIFTCVGDDKAIEETINTALKGNAKGKLFVDCSTIHPDTTDKLAKTINDAGAEFVACPGKRQDAYPEKAMF